MKQNIKKIRDITELLSDRETLDLLIMVQSTRPGCLIMDPNESLENRLQKFCKQNNYSFKQKKDNTSKLGKKGFFITENRERLEIINRGTGRFYGASDKKVGKFLGFPEESISYFNQNIEEGPIEPQAREKRKQLVEQGVITEEEADISKIVSYVPKPSEKSIEKAVKRGKTHIRNLKAFDQNMGSKIGTRAIEDFYNKVSDFKV
ncbi:hypothetical protein GLT90_01360 [Nanohaloarchaea archaeon H12]|nr:hypothetical protein [Nanohaloarchaea archaeon H12]